MKNFDYKVNRTENCIMVKTSEWIENTSNLIQKYRLSGRQLPTYFTKVIDENIIDEKFKEAKSALKEDVIVLLTRIVSNVAYYRSYSINNEKYYDIPVMQIIGTFKDNTISYDNLQLFYDKIIIEKIEVNHSLLLPVQDNTMIGKIVKVGNCRFNKKWERLPLSVKEGNIVLIKDNATTEVTFNSKKYYITEENSVVGIWDKVEKLSLENLKLINESVILKENFEDISVKSSILITPEVSYDDLDVSDRYNKNIFKVIKADLNLTQLKKNDTIFINRDITNYVYFDNKKYFVINGINDIEGKIIND